jgi:hypothetical protein
MALFISLMSADLLPRRSVPLANGAARTNKSTKGARACLFLGPPPSSRTAACISYECRRRRMNFAVDPKQPEAERSNYQRHLTFCIRARRASADALRSAARCRCRKQFCLISCMEIAAWFTSERALPKKNGAVRQTKRKKRRTGSRRSFCFSLFIF